MGVDERHHSLRRAVDHLASVDDQRPLSVDADREAVHAARRRPEQQLLPEDVVRALVAVALEPSALLAGGGDHAAKVRAAAPEGQDLVGARVRHGCLLAGRPGRCGGDVDEEGTCRAELGGHAARPGREVDVQVLERADRVLDADAIGRRRPEEGQAATDELEREEANPRAEHPSHEGSATQGPRIDHGCASSTGPAAGMPMQCDRPPCGQGADVPAQPGPRRQYSRGRVVLSVTRKRASRPSRIAGQSTADASRSPSARSSPTRSTASSPMSRSSARSSR